MADEGPDPENYVLVAALCEDAAVGSALIVCGEYGMEVSLPSQ